MSDKTILIVGTFDTKDEELTYMADVIRAQGGGAVTMDVSVLGDPTNPCDYSKHQVAEAGGSSIQAAIDGGDENLAMQIMADGASALALRLYREGAFDGVITLGGTMGTDLALDVCQALPVGVPKYVVSTVSFSPLLPPERLAADIQMILWAGGLYGLNAICKASLSQAAGAVLGAARAVEKPDLKRPLIGMTSFGKTVLRYMVDLKPALAVRGYDLAVFHATGMGGRAFESLASEGVFRAVMDFATQEVSNHTMGSTISAGADRMTGAGRRAVPQLLAPGCYDLVDYVGWQDPPQKLCGQESHAHNRLLSSVMLTPDQRREVARAMCDKMTQATGPTVFLLPLHGGNEWDRLGGPLCDPEGLAAYIDEMRTQCPAQVELRELDCHINDPSFTQAALQVFDDWIAKDLLG
ncbi:MAG: Tm-1-like ATP-binding domain-containing protein [Pelagimonas sp.]|uniref:Tm-1-like ATP-binding domain-containing protein n=1 Tax=Pelagimonas sp. TaxID=2073170 RepID=UPI003D6B8DC6